MPGYSGRALSRIALGCGNFGGVGSAPEFFGQGLSQDQALELMDAAWQAGLTHFDTADAYGGGRSEAAIGHWIASRGVRPQLTTKTFNPMQAGADHGLRPERIARQLRASLDRLGVDQVDLYLAHDFDPQVPLAESLGAFAQAQAEGAILGYGVSNFGAAQLTAALVLAAGAAARDARPSGDAERRGARTPGDAQRRGGRAPSGGALRGSQRSPRRRCPPAVA